MQRLLRTFLSLMTADLLVLRFALSGVMLASGSPKNTGRPRITGIDQVTIYVSDVEKSRRFYSDVLGLTAGCPQYSGSDSCFRVRPSEQRIVLKLVPPQIRIDAHQSWLAEVTFATDDVLHLRDYLLAMVSSRGPMQKNSDGAQSFRVRDPEGNRIGFVTGSPSKIGYAPSSKQISSQMIHAGFVVKDLAAENRFYVDFWGFVFIGKAVLRMTARTGTNCRYLTVLTGSNTCSTFLRTPTTKNVVCRIIFRSA